MSDKRQNAAVKPVVPKPATQTQELNGQAATLSKAIGARVRITTSLPDHTLEGTLFTACPISNVVALNTATTSSQSSSSPGSYHIVPVSHIASFAIISLPSVSDRAQGSGPGFDGALPSISKLDLDALRAREEAAVRRLKDRENTRNRSAGKDAQDLFDQMSRTLPTRWHDNSIVVNDAVMISPPYGVMDAKANKDGERSLQQVRKIMEAYYNKKKAATPGTGAAGAATVQGGATAVKPAVAMPMPRKGG